MMGATIGGQHGETAEGGDAMSEQRLPDDFVWGAATAAYQIEGAVREDGRGVSIWDTFSHTPENTLDGATGDVACDHYHRWRYDVRLMQDLGLQAYRLSVAWPRVMPDGTGEVNGRGLDFYDRLVDALLAAKITPYVTLYHWDLPQALQDQGGWANRETIEYFVAYADVVGRRLGDRVRDWITHNEPYVVAFVGNYQGRHAPGVQDLGTALQVAHNVLVSHGRAVSVLRAASPRAQVGITVDLGPIHPAAATAEDEAAARRFDGHWNRWFLDPVFGRGYPADMVELYGDRMPKIAAGDLDEIAVPTDFLGINYYRPAWARAVSVEEDPLRYRALTGAELAEKGFEVTEMGWPVVPEGLEELLIDVHREYAPPALYVTENGAAFDDQLVNGKVRDERRIAYLRGHFEAARRAIAAGVPLRGYFVWSLMDNFEWALGYSKRFGLLHVDYETQKRTLKDSALWYRRVIEANVVLGPEEN
jgi:beta-glucosidase